MYLRVLTALMLGCAMGAPALAAPAGEDVPADHWARQAVIALAEKYRVMDGFPDGSFRGEKTLSRYELAVALYRLLGRLDERALRGSGQTIEIAPGVNPDDLKTLGLLQREFRTELSEVAERLGRLEERLGGLESRMRLAGRMQADYRAFQTGAPGPTGVEPRGDWRARLGLRGEAELQPDLRAETEVLLASFSPPSPAMPFWHAPRPTPRTELSVPVAWLRYEPAWGDATLGLGALREALPLGGPWRRDPFRIPVWDQALGGYGYAGTPGMLGGAIAQSAGGAPQWLAGTSILADLLDPNNATSFGPTGDWLGAARTGFGPFGLGLALRRGGMASGWFQDGGQPPSLASNLPAFEHYQDGARAIAEAELELASTRLSVLWDSPTGAGLRGRLLGMSLNGELGPFTYCLESAASQGAGGWNHEKSAARVLLGDTLAHGGLLGLGLVAGGGFQSLGIMARSPGFLWLPPLSLAIQQSAPQSLASGAGPLTGPALASGLSLGTHLPTPWGPDIGLEYSLGKFSLGGDNGLFGSAPFSHGQWALSTRASF